MAHCNNLHALGSLFRLCFAISLDGIKDPKFIKPEFPWSDGVGSERLLPLCSDFCIHLQVRNDPSHDDALIMWLEVCNVALCAFRQRDLVIHAGIVPEKPGALNLRALGLGMHNDSALQLPR